LDMLRNDGDGMSVWVGLFRFASRKGYVGD
jgi:hypothetical protein